MLCGAGSPLHQRLLQWDTELLGMGFLTKSTYNSKKNYKTNKRCQNYINYFVWKEWAGTERFWKKAFMYIFYHFFMIFIRLCCWCFLKYAFLPTTFLLHACLQYAYFAQLFFFVICFSAKCFSAERFSFECLSAEWVGLN